MASQTKLWISTDYFSTRFWIIVEVLATATLIVGVAFNSWNIYPLNLYINVLGNFFWFMLALHWRKLSLLVIQVVVLGLYVAGTVKVMMGV
jgi:hypothetical protein